MTRKLLWFFAVILLVTGATVVACKEALIASSAESELSYQDIIAGSGPAAEIGDIAVIHVSGWLVDNGVKGDIFISSRERGMPVTFKIGTDRVIQGWNAGVVGMKPGGKRMLWVPSHLAYGAKGAGTVVKPNQDLMFEIELVEIK